MQAQGTHEREAGLVQAGLHSSTFIAITCYTKAKRGVVDPVMEKGRKNHSEFIDCHHCALLFVICQWHCDYR